MTGLVGQGPVQPARPEPLTPAPQRRPSPPPGRSRSRRICSGQKTAWWRFSRRRLEGNARLGPGRLGTANGRRSRQL